MKDKAILIILLFLLRLNPTHLYAQVYSSKDFEKKGVIEYIDLVNKTYWTNKYPNRISLNVSDDFDYLDHRCEVSFPNDNQVYLLQAYPGELLCIHPDNREQWFEALPSVYYSKDFEGNGFTEYIEYDGNEYIYFTSEHPDESILLELGNPGDGGIVEVKFPGKDEKLKLYHFGCSYIAGIEVVFEDGKRQSFEFYHYDGDLKY